MPMQQAERTEARERRAAAAKHMQYRGYTSASSTTQRLRSARTSYCLRPGFGGAHIAAHPASTLYTKRHGHYGHTFPAPCTSIPSPE
eukprot:scaffold2857_cov121-Isochrysis_galbana.AAC.12